MKKIILDYKKCARCGLCANVCPEVFVWDSKSSEPFLKNGSKKERGAASTETDKPCAEEAARLCPVVAIEIVNPKKKII